MYLGLIRQGIQLMLLFFLVIFIARSYDFNYVDIFLPIIWCYSVFDVNLKSKSDEPLTDGDLPLFANKELLKNLSKENSFEKYIAYILIFMGIFSLVNNLFFPFIENYFPNYYPLVSYVKTFFVSAVLIIIGIYIIIGKKDKKKKGDDVCIEEE